MKKLLVFMAMLCAAAFGFSKAAFAAGATVDNYADFKSYATNGGEIQLGADIVLTGNTFVKQPLTVDLNGHTLTADSNSKMLLLTSTLTVTDSSSDQSGRITGAGNYYLRVGNGASSPGTLVLESGNIGSNGSYDVLVGAGEMIMNGGTVSSSDVPVIANGGNFTINGGLVTSSGTAVRGNKPESLVTMNGGKIETTGDALAVILSGGSKMIMNDGLIEALDMGARPGTGGVGVIVYRDGEFTMNDGKILSASSCVMSNGSNEDWNNSAGVNAKFTINGGELTSIKHSTIYAPQYQGSVLITGGDLTGKTTAIELRGGSLRIEGGNFTSTSEEFSVENNTSGTTTKGAAVAIIQHTTVDTMNVQICNGTFKGIIPLIEANPNGNSAEDIAKITMTVDNSCGTPVFISSGDQTVYSEDFDGFITGGRYTHDVTDLVADGYGTKTEDGMFVVHEWHDVAINQPQMGTAETSTYRAMVGDVIDLNIDASDNASLLSIDATDENGEVVETNGSSIVMPDSNRNIRVRFTKVNANESTPDTSGVSDSDAARDTIIHSLQGDEGMLDLIGDNDPTIELTVEDADGNEDALRDIPAENPVLVGGSEIRAVVKVGDNVIGEINPLSEDVAVNIILPDDLPAVPDGLQRKFYLVGDGIVIEDDSEDGTVASFMVRNMGNYTLAYADVIPAPETPNTGDAILESVTILTVSTTVLGFTIARRKKN